MSCNHLSARYQPLSPLSTTLPRTTSTMSDKLWCIVEGDSEPFTVTASSPGSEFIIDLQNKIKEVGIKAAALAKDLTL